MVRKFLVKKKQKGKKFNKIDNIISLKDLNFNVLKLVAVSSGRITDKQLIAITAVINKTIKKVGFLSLKIFCDHPITKKSLGIRMGKGKGSINHRVYNSNMGVTICSIKSFFLTKAYKALKLAQIRLPIKTKILNTNV